MAVQVWIGEKPEHPNERRAIVALANGLERLDGLYLILANFSVGGRAIDLVVIKQDAVFIIELKHCDGKVFGDVNGPWFVESANGVRKRLNAGRKNPYNQVVSYYYSLINFLNERRGDFLSPNKAASIDFRTCRRVIVIAPTLQPESHVDIDWKVDLKGLDELPIYLVTERSSEVALTDEEMLVIPQLLHCTRWNEVNALIAGVLPEWDATPTEVPDVDTRPVMSEATVIVQEPLVAPSADEPQPAVPELTFQGRARRTLQTWPGRAAVAFGVLSLVLLLTLFLRPTTVIVPRPDQSNVSLIGTTGPEAAGGIGAGGIASGSCVWSGFQPVGRRQTSERDAWENVGGIGAAPALKPDVVVTLEEVSFCNDQIIMTWSVQNNMSDQAAVLPLTSQNIAIRDEHGTEYTIADVQSKPAEIRAAPGQQKRGTATITRQASLNAATLKVTLKNQPFGEAFWLVQVSRGT